MKVRYFIYAVFIFINACSFSKKAEISLIQEAEIFTTEIIKAYFQKDCAFVIQAMNDEIYIMDGDGIIQKKGKEERICQSIKKAIRDSSKTFEDYTQTYKTELLTRSALEEKFKLQLPDYYETRPNDFFFIGFELKEGKSKSDDFIWDDLFIFMVRKEGDTWAIKGLSG